MRRIGKIGRANIKARKIIAEIAEEKGLDRCEQCGGTFGVAPAHHRRREWYKGDVEKLSDFKHWIVLCQPCHEVLDNPSKTTWEEVDALFEKLRE